MAPSSQELEPETCKSLIAEENQEVCCDSRKYQRRWVSVHLSCAWWLASPAAVQGASAPADQGKRAVVAGIGLQAFRMEVHDPGCLMGAEDVIFEAPTPWWRTTELGTATLGN